jgi:hypothetical protein
MNGFKSGSSHPNRSDIQPRHALFSRATGRRSRAFSQRRDRAYQVGRATRMSRAVSAECRHLPPNPPERGKAQASESDQHHRPCRGLRDSWWIKAD